MSETFDWLKPAPLWQENGRDMLLEGYKKTFRQPQLLGYDHDGFMEAFFAAAETGSSNAFPIAKKEPLQTSDTLKLFQPAHGRFYLVCASLCCIRPGFPDRVVRLTDGELIYFVLRKKETGQEQEYGWVVGPNGPVGWQPVSSAKTVLPGEEKLPLATVPTCSTRRLAYGYLPVASRDAYPALPSELPGTPEPTDARVVELQSRFTAQLTWIDEISIPTNPTLEAEQSLRLSVYLQLDLWEYLQTQLPVVGQALADNDTSDLTGAAAALVTFLDGMSLYGTVSLKDALVEAALNREELNDLADDEELPDPFMDTETGDPNQFVYTMRGLTLDTAGLETAVSAALDEADEAVDIEESPVTVPKLRPDTAETFLVRCVYERPFCREQRYWVSEPTEIFQLASFYDPDAPARPVRIQMPDISMSTLRRFRRGIGFVLPEALQQKLTGISAGEINMLSVTSSDISSLGIGYLCTFSLPIITICAFILLLVLVIVLNLVFWWIPFFKICLPIPKVE